MKKDKTDDKYFKLRVFFKISINYVPAYILNSLSYKNTANIR